MRGITTAVAALAAAALMGSTAHAAVSLNLVASFARGSAFNGPFGLAYDGSNIWWSNSGGKIFEMTTAGVDTGKSVQGPYWSALAYNDATSQLAVMQSGSLVQFDRPTGADESYTTLNPTSTAIAGGYGGLIDGLDIQGGNLWWSPDVDQVFNSPVNGTGSRTTFLGGAGGYSGVEYLTAGGHNYVVVVNDASNPRRLCIHETDATEIGCTALANSRYEDLAFDGRYLYAADFYGARIDKIDLLVDGGSIFQPGVPEPSTWAMMIIGFGAAGSVIRRRKAAVA